MHYFLGAHSTGKTTLCNEILKVDPNFVIIESLVRSMNKGFSEVGVSFTEVNKQKMLNNLSLALHNFTHKSTQGIATRSLIDQIVYNEIVSPELDVTFLQEQWDKDVMYVGKIFITPIEFPLVVDEARVGLWSSTSIQKDIEEKMEKFLLDQVSLGFIKTEQIIFLRGSVEERFEKLRTHLKI